MNSSLCLQEILAFMTPSELLELNLLNRRVYERMIPRCFPKKECRLWAPQGAYLMFPGDKMFEMKAVDPRKLNHLPQAKQL